ncbi:hypothetical protein F0P96_11660 [Hymenobacter busanensis]|uniref:Uncharacterized protein n=1 Tax=Hymenobacter busanensis TaxID=2607656 RepID=A0A7L4ZX80_9BACT|nr:hypothetical protein [Hymenobacter busanensis]KAA9332138.1 hypothetical protein F0P96_11660 [Hymenobacter busanensis]QHJ07523.1 hypothetical protein GUY19_09610 [Hymenobacter busanensis]
MTRCFFLASGLLLLAGTCHAQNATLAVAGTRLPPGAAPVAPAPASSAVLQAQLDAQRGELEDLRQRLSVSQATEARLTERLRLLERQQQAETLDPLRCTYERVPTWEEAELNAKARP